MTDVGTTRLLTGHFLRRFLDNDLLSPSGDGHEHASLVVSGLFVVGLWASFALVLKSLSPYLSPFGLLLSTLNDKYVGLAVTMIVTALGAVIEWDALGLDRRDWIVLGPLPISTRVLLLAKIRALALFVVMFAIALGGLPSALYPPLQAATLGVGVVGTFWMTAVHLAVSLAASTLAFLAVLTLREALRAVVGPALFRGLSPILQSAAVLSLTVGLLLVATARVDVPGRVNRVGRVDAGVYMSPPMWFVGLYETMTGPVVSAAQATAPTGQRQFWTLAGNQRDRARYLGGAAAFAQLAGIAVLALSLLAVICVGALAVNRRAARADVAGTPFLPVLRNSTTEWVTSWLVPHPVSRAGFFFTLQTLGRSASHRAYLAGYLAVGVAVVVVTASAATRRDAALPADRLLAVQMILVFCLLAGLRAVFSIPSELRANWTFRVGWDGDGRRYFLGVRRAVQLGALLPLLLALAPFHAYLWGVRIAAAHLVIGWLASSVLANLWLLSVTKLPFTCSYSPKGTLRTRWPWYLLAFLVSTFGFARIERLALGTFGGVSVLAGALCALVILTALSRKWIARHQSTVIFDDPQESPTQRLGLVSGE